MIAENVGASLDFGRVHIQRAPKADGPHLLEEDLLDGYRSRLSSSSTLTPLLPFAVAQVLRQAMVLHVRRDQNRRGDGVDEKLQPPITGRKQHGNETREPEPCNGRSQPSRDRKSLHTALAENLSHTPRRSNKYPSDNIAISTGGNAATALARSAILGR